MQKKNKDPRNVEERQSDVDNPAQLHNTKNVTNNKNTDGAPNPLLGQKAEEYLREQANIEDLPDEKYQQDYDEKINKEKK